MTDITINSLTGIANHLIQEGLLQPQLAKQAYDEANQRGISFLTYLVSHDMLCSDVILKTCIKRFSLSAFDLNHYNYDWLKFIDIELIFRYRIIPLHKKNDVLYVGIADPTQQDAFNIIMFNTGFKIFPILVDENKLDKLIKSLQKNISHQSFIESSLLHDISLDEKTTATQESISNEDEPFIKFTDQIIFNAVTQSASDIHIEFYEKYCRIRYRIDGLLHQVNELPGNLALRLSTRLKVMSQLDIAERRLPQDGRFQWRHVDVRINTCPTIHGEKIVLRLLDTNQLLLDYTLLGFNEQQRCLFQHKITAPHGLILVTGPTGSGKTVTLYSALNYLNTVKKNIVTIENPVEIQLPGINQININSKLHLDFSTMLRTILRQDPDIIMIGEIRDKETAETAIQAAETGHLVLSTIHTNSALETLHRFKSMRIAPYLFAKTLILIIAQRLIRILCDYCKQLEWVTQSVHDHIIDQSKPTYRARGCQHCFDGYRGRTGIYEFFSVTEKISELILSNASLPILEKEAIRSGFTSLYAAGVEKIINGTTSFMEIQRVLQR